MESKFTITRLQNAAMHITEADRTRDLQARTLAEAQVEAQELMNAEVGVCLLNYIDSFGKAFPMLRVRADRRTVRELKRWRAGRADGSYLVSKPCC
jgi:hypothetical protein